MGCLHWTIPPIPQAPLCSLCEALSKASSAFKKDDIKLRREREREGYWDFSICLGVWLLVSHQHTQHPVTFRLVLLFRRPVWRPASSVTRIMLHPCLYKQFNKQHPLQKSHLRKATGWISELLLVVMSWVLRPYRWLKKKTVAGR